MRVEEGEIEHAFYDSDPGCQNKYRINGEWVRESQVRPKETDMSDENIRNALDRFTKHLNELDSRIKEIENKSKEKVEEKERWGYTWFFNEGSKQVDLKSVMLVEQLSDSVYGVNSKEGYYFSIWSYNFFDKIQEAFDYMSERYGDS